MGLVTTIALDVNIGNKCIGNNWKYFMHNYMCFHHQDYERPSPPQKPLPADPLGRSSCLGRSTTAVHVPGSGPLPIPIPTVPRPAPTMPLPSRWVVLNLLSLPHLPASLCESSVPKTSEWLKPRVIFFYFLSVGKQNVINCIVFKSGKQAKLSSVWGLTPCLNIPSLIRRAWGQPSPGLFSPCLNMHYPRVSPVTPVWMLCMQIHMCSLFISTLLGLDLLDSASSKILNLVVLRTLHVVNSGLM